jgi:transposase-like protein
MGNANRNIQGKLTNLKAHQQTFIEKIIEKFQNNNSIDVETLIENNVCRNCGGEHLVKNGQSKGIKRFKCKSCGTTQSNTANTPLYRLKLKDLWVDFIHLMLTEHTPLTLEQISKRLSIDIKTAHSWRHKFLTSLNDVKPLYKGKYVEMDEVYLNFRVKGRLGAEKFNQYDHENKAKCVPNNTRIDEIDREKHNSMWMCIHNRMGDFDFVPLKIQQKGHVGYKDLLDFMKDVDLEDTTVITDANRSLKRFLKDRPEANHLQFKSKDIKKGILIDKVAHNNNINNVMSLYGNWIKTFKGYSTKYEWNYLKWFRFHRLFQKDYVDIEKTVKFSIEDKQSHERHSNIFGYYKDFIAA